MHCIYECKHVDVYSVPENLGCRGDRSLFVHVGVLLPGVVRHSRLEQKIKSLKSCMMTMIAECQGQTFIFYSNLLEVTPLY